MKHIAYRNRRPEGSVLVVVVLVFFLLSLIGMSLLTISYGVRQRSVRLKNEAMAMLAAEAGYEQGILWMEQQADILGGLATNAPGASGSNDFGLSRYNYQVTFHGYIGARPIFRIISNGYAGAARRVVDVFVMQAISGWDMGMCRIPLGPSGTSNTGEVVFATNESIYMNVHINRLNDSPDIADIYIHGTPHFPPGFKVSMGESRHRTGGTHDKYAAIRHLFQGTLLFDQPNVRITDPVAIESKLSRFRNTTKPAYVFTPQVDPAVTVTNGTAMPAVHLEFFETPAGGQVRITNNSTVIGGRRIDSRTLDYMIADPVAMTFTSYPIYAYHYRFDPAETGIPAGSVPYTVLLTDTYVTQTFAGHTSEPGGQIYVDGNVVLGGNVASVVQGKVTVVATGNIWIANSVRVAGDRYPMTDPQIHRRGMPASNNPNALGLIARGVIKVIDPGMSEYGALSNRGVGIGTPAARIGRSIYTPVGSGAAG
ncbi:MAG TPA: hypothetical protein VLH60_04670, partial [Sedimentisphaerales bacterium]|nr:hypothetical protein [Sedimentisphaerales bacterium]